MFDGSTNDNGTQITCQIDFRGFDFGSSNFQKVAQDGEFQFANSSGTATLYFRKDDNQWATLGSSTIGGTSAVLPVSLPFNLPGDSGVNPWIYTMYGQGRSKYWQFRLVFAGSSMNLKQLTSRAQVENFITR
jgi:hypothetical protein